MTYRLSLEINWLPESLNTSLRANRYARYAENKSWDLYVAALTGGKRPRAPLKRAKLTLIRHSHRMLDFDGMIGSFKPVVDALVSSRIIADDSWGVVGAWEVDQRFRAKAEGPRLTILIEELAPPHA